MLFSLQLLLLLGLLSPLASNSPKRIYVSMFLQERRFNKMKTLYGIKSKALCSLMAKRDNVPLFRFLTFL
jgi:hypothetical protein